MDPRAAAASREGFRQFLHLTIKPLAALVVAELRDKLEVPELAFHFDELSAADIAGRARGVWKPRKGGNVGRGRPETFGARMSTLLFLRLLNGPRFLNRTSTDSVFAFRVSCLRQRSQGEVFGRIEAELKAQFLLNWTGDPPAMFIYGDSPDRDERSQGALVIGLASSDSEDQFGLAAGLPFRGCRDSDSNRGSESSSRLGDSLLWTRPIR